MPSSSTITAVKNALSHARMQTYENTLDTAGNSISTEVALGLYAWNAQVSGALLKPLHICEVVIRNATSEALAAVYGDKWPWAVGFERSLKNPVQGYSPRKDLQRARNKQSTTGKVIPELKFAFWQRLFTRRFDGRLWEPYIMSVFPNLPSEWDVSRSRSNIYNELEYIRKLRNRIAHHEPIFTRNLEDDFQKISLLIEHRCSKTSQWMQDNQYAMTLINSRPI